MNSELALIELKLSQLDRTVSRRSSRGRCLRRWSEFVRERDGYRCVLCSSVKHLSAHHICRKSFLPEAEYQTGNGITLCRECHRRPHDRFNGRANLSMPMDAEGGENLDIMEQLYSVLAADALERRMHDDRFYYLSDSVLAKFKMFQGLDTSVKFPGTRLQQARWIWAQPPQGLIQAVIAANFLE